MGEGLLRAGLVGLMCAIGLAGCSAARVGAAAERTPSTSPADGRSAADLSSRIPGSPTAKPPTVAATVAASTTVAPLPVSSARSGGSAHPTAPVRLLKKPPTPTPRVSIPRPALGVFIAPTVAATHLVGCVGSGDGARFTVQIELVGGQWWRQGSQNLTLLGGDLWQFSELIVDETPTGAPHEVTMSSVDIGASMSGPGARVPFPPALVITASCPGNTPAPAR